jgi:hypothetical protein
MKGLILYRSHYGNTKLVADTIAKQIKASGHEVTVQDVREALPELLPMDFVFIGSPTRFAKPDGKALKAIKQLKKKNFTKKPVIIYDTYGPAPVDPQEILNNKWLYPGAAGIMHRTAQEQGLNVCPQILRCAVQTGQKGPLAEHELEKAAAFTNGLLAKIEG